MDTKRRREHAAIIRILLPQRARATFQVAHPMIFRTRMLNTLALLCHLLLLPGVVTSQLLAEASAPAASQEVIIRAQQQEKAGDVFHLRGDVEITFRQFTVRADEITYDSSSGEITARGNLRFQGGPHDERLSASHGSYNLQTESGRFYEVVGSTGARFRGRGVILTSSNPFVFSGKMVEKRGNRYIVHDGSVTSCRLPDPKWSFSAERVEVVPGGNARIYHSTFYLFKVPIFYFPFVAHPVENLGRQSGFLIPTVGQSSRKGTIIGDAFYWAINRSMDATFGAEYYSRRGFAQHGEFRARPSDQSFVLLQYFGVVDRDRQGGQEARLSAEGVFPRRTRGVANIDYLSSFVFRLAFAETFALAVNSEVRSLAFLSHNYRGLGANLLAARYQNFQSSTPGDLITIVHAPTFEFSGLERPILGSRFHWSFNAAIEGLSRREPNFVTATVGRVDLEPRLSLPLLWKSWSIRPELALRNTYYSDRLVPGSGGGIGRASPNAVNRRALEGSLELRPPALARVFETPVLGHKLKHSFEPRMVYRMVSGVDSFPSIIRFDARDILSDTNELEYALVNRIYAKRAVPGPGECDEKAPQAQPGARVAVSPAPEQQAPEVSQPEWAQSPEGRQTPPCLPGQARDVVSWELAQKYFFDPGFGGAVVNGRRNVFTTTAEFTGIAFLTEPRRFSPVISRLRVRATHSADIEWHLDYDSRKGRLSSSTAFVNYSVGNFALGGGHTFLHAPGEVIVSQPIPSPGEFNQFRTLLRYGNPNKRGWSSGATIGFDANLRFLQYSAAQTTYNWDCCGLTFEYRRFALGGVRNENQFRFALTLANVGTFGTLKKQERLF
jgi:LPS-assembly protein